MIKSRTKLQTDLTFFRANIYVTLRNIFIYNIGFYTSSLVFLWFCTHDIVNDCAVWLYRFDIICIDMLMSQWPCTSRRTMVNLRFVSSWKFNVFVLYLINVIIQKEHGLCFRLLLTIICYYESLCSIMSYCLYFHIIVVVFSLIPCYVFIYLLYINL